MGNMCCRRIVVYAPNEATDGTIGRCQPSSCPPLQTQAMSNAYHSVGDDCAINELLEGRMDLDVIVPDGRQVRLTVERRTPMMDLLVQAASAMKISPGGHVIHVFDEATGGGGSKGTLQYKPSTPIGSLDTNTICIVPKKEVLEQSIKRAPKTANRPFEPTFRVQVHLPRNQLTVLRVSPRIRISELHAMVCQEKALDSSKYQLVRPSNPAQLLGGDMTLAEYGATEITLLSNSSIESHICNSTSHIIPYSKGIEEKKKKTGILGLLAEDCNHNNTKRTTDTTDAPVPTNPDHQATSTATTALPRTKTKKRRPAPPPPAFPEAPSHSRQSSSDSSGYHEVTSSSSCHDAPSSCTAPPEKAASDSSGVSSLDAKVPVVVATAVQHPFSSSSKKRRAPQPPKAPGGLDGAGSDEAKAVITVTSPSKQSDVVVVEETASKDIETAAKQDTETVPPVEFDTKEESVFLDDDFDKLDDEPPPAEEECPAVTRVALAALNARLEQDVSQQQIASNIEAAFYSLDRRRTEDRPSLVSIKQRRAPELPTAPIRCEKEPEPAPCESSEPHCEIATCDKEPEDVQPPATCHQEPEQQSPIAVCEDREQLHSPAKEPEPFRYGANHCDSPTEDREPEPCPEEPKSLPPEETRTRPSYAASTKTLRRSSSLLSLTECKPKERKAQSQLSLEDRQEQYQAEQRRLQQEYLKLQKQFLVWQRQLLQNHHTMLREECIVPQFARTLSMPAQDSPSPQHHIARSLSYETTTLPRAAINIPSLDTATLRSSKTKSHFKPPLVRPSTQSRQRLPPELRRSDDDNTDLDVSEQCVVAPPTPPPPPPAVPNGVGVAAPPPPLAVPNGVKAAPAVPNGVKAPPPPPVPNGVKVGPPTAAKTTKTNGMVKRGPPAPPKLDPREELMLEIRKFGGRTALRKVSLELPS